MYIKDIYITFIKKHWKYYIFYFLSFISIPINQVVVPHYYGKIIELLKGKNIEKAGKFLAKLLGIWVLIQGLNYTQALAELNVWPRFTSYSEGVVFDTIVDRYRGNFQELEVGKILTKMIKLPWILDSIQDNVQDFVLNYSVVILSNFGYLTYQSPYLGLVYVLGVCSLLYCGTHFYANCKHFKIIEENEYDTTHGNIEDSLSNLVTVYANNKEQDEMNKMKKESSKVTDITIKRGKCNIKYRIYFSILNVLIFIGLNYTALHLFKKGKIKIAALTAIFILNYNILGSLIIYFKNVRNYIELKANLAYVNEFIDSLPDKIEPPKNKNNTLGGFDIDMRNVYFTSNDGKKEILKDISIFVKEGESVAIMGSIGSGKSTIGKLLMGLQQPTKGGIFIGGKDIREIGLEKLRDMIEYVPQTPSLFNRTLWENLSYGFKEGEVTEETFLNILRELEMNEIADIFASRMHQSVGKKGSFLSGGQRQIVWLLRCLVKKSKIVILDEPTSALDEENRDRVIKLLQSLKHKKTLLVITHDKDLLRHMSRLLYVDAGKITKDKVLVKQTPF